MFRFDEIVTPKSLPEAAKLMADSGSTAVAGGLFLRFAKTKCRKAVDLSALGLDFVKKNGAEIEIGATTPLRKVELETAKMFGGALSKAASLILGVQFRNLATIGGAVMSGSGYSNIITVLVALDAQLVFASGKKVALTEFLAGERGNELLEKIVVKNDFDGVSFQLLQHTTLDIAVLNVAVAKKGKDIAISVGARPQVAVRAVVAEKAFAEGKDATEVASMAIEQIKFGKDIRGSVEYRKALAQGLIERAITEASK